MGGWSRADGLFPLDVVANFLYVVVEEEGR